MLLEENQITFHSEDGLIFDGVKDYARQIAEMIGLGSDTEFAQAGVSLTSLYRHAGYVSSFFFVGWFSEFGWFGSVWLNRRTEPKNVWHGFRLAWFKKFL